MAANVNHAIWCARGATTTTDTWSLFALGTNFRFDYKVTVSSNLTPALATGTKYTVAAEGNVFTWSGGNGYTHTADPAFTAAGGPLTLFYSYYNGTGNNPSNYGKHRLYSFKVWRSGDLIHYFVPCKDSSGAATLVDICDDPATLTKDGTFTAGGEGHYYDDTLLVVEDVLAVAGNPSQYGSPSPAYGKRSGLSAGDTVAVSCGATPTINDGKTYICTGWKLYDINGDVVSDGTETAFTYEHPTPAAYRRLEWQWTALWTLLPIPDQVNETFDPCRPELTVSNMVDGTTWPVGGDISSPYFDVEYANNYGANTATATVTGKGDYAGLSLVQTFKITATKLEDDNISTTDVSARRREVAGKYVYIFTNAAAAHVSTVKRDLLLTDYLVVGGGGGGGSTMGGGGGAGGVTNATGIIGKLLSDGDTFTVSVGAGGAGASNYNGKGANGKATAFTLGDISVSVAGGGGGGSWFNPAGVAGASGGGGTKGGAGGAGIDGIGYAGATAGANSRSGGGGGAGHAGYQYTDDPKRAGNGGEGIVSSITGEAVYYGGGGGGGGSSSGNDLYYPGFGGLGGGGDGERSVPGHPGADGFGGGGGGGGWTGNQQNGGKGGSGTVIVALQRPPFEVVSIPDQVNETFEPCRPEFIVSNNLTGAKWTIGGDIASPYFDVEYSDNFGSGTATVTVIGKGEFYGAYCVGYFNITATKLEDANISTTDTSARRHVVDGKSVYVFTAASEQTVLAKRGIYLADYLIVGGGGGGGCRMAGGGGAGGVTNATGLVGMYVDKGDTFTLAVGAGGAGATATSQKGGNGGDTSLNFGLLGATVSGGGGGGSWDTSKIAGANGASGGGGCQGGAGGTGIDGIGFSGAAGGGNNSARSGGGGGAGHAGYAAVTAAPTHAGYGGEGVSNNITGAWVVYGGGGGGGGSHQSLYWKNDPGLGGLGGGGNGGKDVAGENGVDGLGGGGGGGGAGYGGTATTPIVMPGGRGGSGTVIFSILPADFNIEPIPDQILVAGGSKPIPVVYSGDTLLEKDTDYTVAYTDNDKPGVATMTITGINYYAGKSTTIAFKTFVCYFVDSEAAAEGDGYEGSPFATISNAVEKAKNAIAGGAQFVEIRVANGTYEETNLVLDAPIVIVGEERDDVEIVDNVPGFRAFTLSHEGAEVRNLTISGNGYKTNGGQGGHVRMTAGLVVGCVIKDGRAGESAGYGNGGNVWMSGGRLERCLVTGGRANWGGWNGSKISYGMGLYASGGIIDSCFFKDNRDDNNNGRNYGSVYLAGTATMVNCTVTGGYSRYVTASGIYLDSAKATVVNCVAYGNYGGQNPVNTADSNIGSVNLGRYFHCAAAFTNASCATWTVLTDADFVNYRTFTPSALNYSPTYNNLNAYFNSEEYAAFDWHQVLASPTVDRGTTDTAYRPADSAMLDLDGKDRIAGASIDLGCWECDQSQFACVGSLDRYGALENAAIAFNAFAVGPASDTVFRWDYGNGVTEDTREAAHGYAYPASGYFTVRVSASPDGGTTWTDWYTVPTRVAVVPVQMFVDSNCATPAFPYKTRETAATTLAAAVGALTNNVSENKTIIGGVDIVVLKGSKSNDTGIFLASAVTIRGETGNPADAEIVDNVPGFRAFTLSHPDAVVSNLTISGSGIKTNGSQGGHVRMTAGLVVGCVIKDGRAGASAGYGRGGNVYMTGGRLERCLVANGRANWGAWNGTSESFGMGLYASGGIIDSCFFKDNRDDNNNGRNYGSVCLEGTVTMVNCTVTGGYSRYGTASGIYLNSANAKVVNCVAYGNYGGQNPVNTAASNFGDKNLGRYFHCAAAFTNASCATWTVLTDADFVKYETFTGTTYAQLNTYMTSAEYAAFNWHQKRNSQLIGRGTLDTAYRPVDSVTRDLDGNERVLNRTIDLGCWEVESGLGFHIILR